MYKFKLKSLIKLYMEEANLSNIGLSSGAIKSLELENVEKGSKKTLDVNFIFQIERVTKNNGIYNCTLIDNDSKYGGFLLQYEQKDGTPGIGDIIHVSKIIIAILPKGDSYIYYCKKVKLIRRASQFRVDPTKLYNLSKKKSLENYRNSVYKAQDDNIIEDLNSNDNKGIFDDSEFNLISDLTTFSNNWRLYLKCKVKIPLKNFITKRNKECTLQKYIFRDTKGDEILATCFRKTAENLDKFIQEGGIYEIKKPEIKLADRNFNPTKCDYELLLNESSQIQSALDNGKFEGVIFSIVPLNKIIDLPLGKLVDVIGFILDDLGYQEFQSKNDKTIKYQKIIIGDDTQNRIEVTLWNPLGNPDNNFSRGDLIAIKNCRIKEFNYKKTLETTDSSELKNTLNPNIDKKLRDFYDDHKEINEFKDIEGESNFTQERFLPEFAFIKDVQNTFDEDIDNKDRPLFEIIGTVTKLNHSERNYYIGCSKCHRKMENDDCFHCSGKEKKTIFTISLNIRDSSSYFWVDLFGDVAEKFLGIKGEDYENLVKSLNNEEVNEGLIAINERIEYHTFSFFGKVKLNIYNDQKKHRFTVFRFNERTTEQRKRLTKKLSSLLNI